MAIKLSYVKKEMETSAKKGGIDSHVFKRFIKYNI